MSKYWLLIGQSDSFIRTDNTYAHNAKRLRKLLLILSSRLILELTLLFNCFILINKMPGSNLNFFEMTQILSVLKWGTSGENGMAPEVDELESPR